MEGPGVVGNEQVGLLGQGGKLEQCGLSTQVEQRHRAEVVPKCLGQRPILADPTAISPAPNSSGCPPGQLREMLAEATAWSAIGRQG